ncbi:MAG: hypothetical protein ACLT51_07535 [Faecalibacterium prausnitzii]
MSVKGYKVFNSDWTCRGKQYSCPGIFEEFVSPSVCNVGMHFCKNAADCFRYYDFDPNNHVTEVIAHGTVAEDEYKCATNKLEIVREIPWAEVLEIVNTGKACTGRCNSGDQNSGNWNSGNRNSGNWNSGNRNSGNWNSGNRNSGDQNSGNWNSGNWNSGNRNSGNRNSGDWNSGNRNSGNRNSGDWNSGNRNSGNRNSGNRNSGDWNATSFSNGCFNTVSPKIYMFNKPTDWTFERWFNCRARRLLNDIDDCQLEYVYLSAMTDEEKAAHPEAETTGGYLKERTTADNAWKWWAGLSAADRNVILSLPNFDAAIFREITGIDVSKD